MSLQWISTISWSSAHFYNQQKWSPADNKLKFGKCFSTYGHGHDYQLEIHIENSNSFPNDKVIKILDDLRNHLDHKHLNFDLQEFLNTVPTTENILLYCVNYIQSQLQTNLLPNLCFAKLLETSDIWCEWIPEVVK